jgi:hypothetical protein
MQIKSAILNFSAGGDNTVLPAAPFGMVKIKGISFTVAGATNITFKNGTSTVSGAYVFTGNGSSMTAPILESDAYYWWADPSQAFVMNLSSGVQLSGTIWYTNG